MTPVEPPPRPALPLAPQSVTNWTLRRATNDDLDDLTRIAIAAFAYDRQWNYRYPHAAEFPEDHYKYTRIRYGEWLDANTTPRCIIMVAECFSPEDPGGKKVAAFSIWRVPPAHDTTEDDVDITDKLKPPSPNPDRRDASQMHMKAYRLATEFAQTKFFDRLLGHRQISLAQLATDPAYFRRGAATKLVEWGIEMLARKQNLPISLFAGPMGYRLYQRMGFRSVVMATVQVSGEKEELMFPGMVWKDGLREEKEQVWDEEGVPQLFVVAEPPN
ncbi:hypothetical protein B0H66DRAFT_472070 [Apodospora peruviana]|uniref:Acyl-CoA N-acyltransferase n=1 Tax=Apodospora peruviana TaxID=516989 RepID=A0AAE0MBJ3_9PEZI|nr:hypothetical protein B0H66DRAFT_472070 [Apodospora peruviana]